MLYIYYGLSEEYDTPSVFHGNDTLIILQSVPPTGFSNNTIQLSYPQNLPPAGANTLTVNVTGLASVATAGSYIISLQTFDVGGAGAGSSGSTTGQDTTNPSGTSSSGAVGSSLISLQTFDVGGTGLGSSGTTTGQDTTNPLGISGSGAVGSTSLSLQTFDVGAFSTGTASTSTGETIIPVLSGVSGLGTAGISPVPVADGIPADIYMDFVNGKYVGANLSSWSFTRAQSKYADYANGMWQLISSSTPAITDKGLQIEQATTNSAEWARDMTNAVWSATNMTTAKSQTGFEGTINAATLLTATADNATITQAITLASALQIYSIFAQVIAGSGNINLTLDGGTTWTPVSVVPGGGWQRVFITQTLANPTIGIKLASNGDQVAVDLNQCESSTGSNAGPTSPIVTTTAAVTRATDRASITGLAIGSTVTLMAKARFRTVSAATTTPTVLEFSDNSNNNRLALTKTGNLPRFYDIISLVSNFSNSGASGSWADNTVGMLIGTIAANDMATSFNGDAVTARSDLGIAPVTTINFGTFNSGSGFWDVQQIAVWLNHRTSNPELQRLTSNAKTPGAEVDTPPIGISASTSVGTFSEVIQTFDVGVSGTGSAASSNGETIISTLSGASGSGSAGSATVTAGALTTVNLTGIASTGSAGSPNISLQTFDVGGIGLGSSGTTTGQDTSSLSGASSTGTAASTTKAISFIPTGIASVGTSATFALSLQTFDTGISSTGSAGTTTGMLTSNPSGVSASGVSSTTSEAIIKAITGVTSSGSSATFSLSISTFDVGGASTGSVGSTSDALTAFLVGSSGSGTAGTARPEDDAKPIGVSAISAAGTTLEAIAFTLTGTSSTSSLGSISVTTNGSLTLNLSGISSLGVAGTSSLEIDTFNETGTSSSASVSGFNSTLVQNPSGVSAVASEGTVLGQPSFATTGTSTQGSAGSTAQEADNAANSVAGVAAVGSFNLSSIITLGSVSSVGTSADIIGERDPAILGMVATGSTGDFDTPDIIIPLSSALADAIAGQPGATKGVLSDIQSNGVAGDIQSEIVAQIGSSGAGEAGEALVGVVVPGVNFDVRQFLSQPIVPTVVSNTVTMKIPSKKLLLLQVG